MKVETGKSTVHAGLMEWIETEPDGFIAVVAPNARVTFSHEEARELSEALETALENEPV